MATHVTNLNSPLREGRRVFFADVFFVFFLLVLAFPLRGELPIIEDGSNFVWKGGWGDLHEHIVFHPNSKIVAADGGWGLQFLAVEDSGKEVRRYPGGSPVFFRSGKYLAYISEVEVGKYEIRIVDFEADTIKLRIARENADPFDISWDEKAIAVGGNNRVTIFDVETGKILREKVVTNDWNTTVEGVNYFPDGKRIFCCLYLYRPKLDPLRYQVIWDLETDEIKQTNLRPPIAISYDGKYLAYAGQGNADGRIATIIDLQTGEEVGYVPAPQQLIAEGIEHLSISPDNRFIGCTIAYPGNPYGFRIWDLKSKRFVYYFFPDRPVTFSPDGRYFAFGLSVWLYNFERIKQKIEEALSEVQEETLSATIIYPNPTHDVVQVRFALDIPLPTTIKVMDLTGRIIRTIENKVLEANEYVYTIDLTDLAAGMYYLQIKAGNRIFNEKIAVSH